jgi:hypothetical protein
MRSDPDRYIREVIVENAFGGTYFKATGIAAKASFRAFEEADGTNSIYNCKKKSRVNDPEKFDNNR